MGEETAVLAPFWRNLEGIGKWGLRPARLVRLDVARPAHGALLALATLAVLSVPFAASAQWLGRGSASRSFLGFVDKDGDGVNDLFFDRNGDGVNDVTGKPYPHHFQYRDADGDGVNDLWVDADGDGVNDVLLRVEFGRKGPQWIDVDGDGIRDRDATLVLAPGRLWRHVLDVDGDGRNDITGLAYRGPGGIRGYRFGCIDEETGQRYEHFIDRNRDGMHDEAPKFGWGRMRRGMDVFIDRDGDGICDGRGAALGRFRGRIGGMGIHMRGGNRP